MAHKNLQILFDKKMNRKQFLAHIGAGMLAIMGISGLLKSLVEYNPEKRTVVNSFGSSAYGGKKK